MKKLLVVFSIILAASCANAQLLLDEKFDYTVGSLLTANGWTNHSGTGTFLTVMQGNLTYPGYPSSGVGNMVYVTGGSGSREDANKPFPQQASGAVYASFLINVDSAGTAGDYFFHLGPNPLGSAYRARVYVKGDAASAGKDGFKFGLSKSGGTGALAADYTAQNYKYNTTYLLIVKYEIIGDTSGFDDVVKLYVNPDITMGEPALADLTQVDTAANSKDRPMGVIALRQGSVGYGMRISGIRVSTNSWGAVTPVELKSFTAVKAGSGVVLKWATATELQNHGFQILRNGKEIAFIQGHGTTTQENSYTYTDKNISSGLYKYELKQVDFDGTVNNVASTEVSVNNAPSEFALFDNYPNPFNPSTTISFQMPVSGKVVVKVFDVTGKEVKTLVNQNMEAGIHQVNFDASGLSSGVYYYSLQSGSFFQTKKLMLLK
jgi:hypothetical protein